MLPSTGYFRGITCPEHLKRTCNRPYCHFRHDSKVSTEENASSSSSSSSSLHTPVQEETEEGKQEEIETQDLPKDLAEYSTTSLTPTTVSTPLEPELTHPQPHSSQQEESEPESAPPPPSSSSSAPVSAASAPVPKSELLQQLMSEALKKVLAENPNLASTVDASSIRIGIDPVTESPPQVPAQVPPQGSPDATKSKKQLYHRPPDTPSYNPTPIRELKKRKQSVDDVNEYFPTGANYSSVTEGKDSGDESTLLGAFSSDDSEEEEKNNDDFDLLEEVLAEHSKNNKVKVKKKKVKELGKLQYSLNNTHKKTVDNSVLITDAKKLTDKEVKRYELPQTENINKVITNGPYFLPPSPIFTSSSDGFEVFNSIVSQQEENLTPILDKTSDKSPTEIESETTNTTPSIDKKVTSKTCTEPVKLTSLIDTEKKVTKASGHTHLPKLVSSIDPPKLSRPNIRAWNPLVRNNLATTEKSNDHLDEMLQLMDGNEPVGNEPAGNEPAGNEPAGNEPAGNEATTKRKINETNHHATANQRDSKHIRPKKKYKVDLNKEIESLSNPALDQSKRTEPEPNQDSTQLPETKEDQETEEQTKDKQTTEEEETEEESDSNENSLEESDEDSDYKRGRYRKKRKRKRSRSSASESDYSRHRRKKRKRSHKRHRKRSHKRSRRRRESTSSEHSKDSEEDKELKKTDEEEEEEEEDDDDIDEEEEEEEDGDNKEVSESEDNNDDDDNDVELSKKSRKHKRKHKYYKKLKHKKNKHKARRKRKRSKSYSRSRSTSESRDSSRSRSRSSRSRSRRSRRKSRNYTDEEKETSLSRSSSRSRSSSKHNKRRDSREDDKKIDDETGKNKKDERKKRDRTISKSEQQTNADEISMPMPIDPTKIKVEKNALIPDLSKVKIEKEDPVTVPEKQDKKETVKTKDNNKSESSHTKETEKINDRRRSSAEEKNKRRKSYERKESAENTSDKTHTRRLSVETKTSDNETGSQRKKTDERRSSGDKTKKTPSIDSQPSGMSMFDLVLASAEPPKQKTLTEVSMFDAVVNSSTNHTQEPPITEKEKITSTHHDLKHKTKDVSHKSGSENAVKSSSSSDKTRSSRSDKNTHSDSHHKHSKSDKTSSHKNKTSSSSSSNSSHHTAGSSSSHKKTSSTSSRVSSSSKRHTTTTTATATTTTTTTTTKTADNGTINKSKKPSDLPTTKNEKETNKHSSRKHSSSSSSSRHHDSSGKKSSSSSSSSKQKESKEPTFDAALTVEGSKAVKTSKKRRVSVDEDSGGGVSEDDHVSLGCDSPLPDLSALDEISQDDWELMLSGHNANTNQEPDGDGGDGDGDDDHDDPWVLEECMKVFNEFQPEANHLENQVLPKKAKVASDESEPSSSALSKQRVARSSSTGNLVRKHSKSRHQKTTPMQLMVERYQKLKEQLKLKEKQLHHLQGGPSTVSSSSTSTSSSSSSGKSSKGAPSSSSSSSTTTTTTSSSTSSSSSSNHSKSQSHNSHSQPTSGKSKVRIAHVPNVSSLLTAHEKIKKQSPSSKSSSSSSSRISAKVAKASGVIPETIAHTVMKGGKRVAHTPKLGVLERPMIQPELGSVVPQNVRQRYLNALIEECKKFVSEREAFNIAAAEERVCYLRARTRMVYLNLVVNAVKRLRTQQQAGEEAQELMDKDPTLAEKMSVEDISSTSSTKPSPASSPSANRPHPLNPNHTPRSHTAVLASGGIKGSWSIEKPKKASNYSQEALKGEAFYRNIQKYVLTEDELGENGYPFPDPEEKGKATVKKIDTRKKISPSALERYCDRCSVLYAVDKWGFPKSSSPCIYHWGRSYRKRKYGLSESSYSCCGGEQGSGGCCQATTHVSVNYNPKNLRGYVRTISKDNSSSNKEVYALDCEMCYTTEGNELTRITVISSNGDVVYEQLVKPENPILDYNTRFSGITEGDMEDVKLTIRDVQAALLARFSDKTILIGHSLESDLHSLKIIHNTVVDTSVVFPHKMGAPFKRALRNLAAEYLKRIIQDDVSGHDSAEDAVACLHLMQWKVKEDLKGFSK